MRGWNRLLARRSVALWGRSVAGRRRSYVVVDGGGGGGGHGGLAAANDRVRRPDLDGRSPGRGLSSGSSKGARQRRTNGVHVFQCSDQLGIVATISERIATRGANILNVDIYIDFDNGSPVFYSRSEFSFDPLQWPRDVMDEDFAEISRYFKAQSSVVRVPGMDDSMKTVILVSRQDHCLVDLLHRWQDGGLPAHVSAVISNHDRGPNTHVGRFLDRHGIPYHYLPTTRVDKKEEEILELVPDTDFLVLARYMQVLSSDFLTRYGKDIINIHHGLLPSFKGANPYRQAYDAGVKLIGATAHFVTQELDSGPIIEQMVDQVSHRDTLPSLATKSENLEKQCLAKAIKYYCEQRIIRYSNNKIIIFS